ncbi:hypothetical protein HDU87_007495 [Geranomyces variabilis]|uniref:G-protein coupled receptors family 3 profile domain-containing protein n=1 Tax=Geranomyces variabilis TaxID=109894 RepID=A0AAD5TUD5_9FUNG|nr:hypothetical protein HDU87_007495 [Geranomyces variabilis]
MRKNIAITLLGSLLLALTIPAALVVPNAPSPALPGKVNELSLGFIWPLDDGDLANDAVIAMRVMEAAVAYVNNDSDILPDAKIKLIAVDSGSTQADGIKAAYTVSTQGIFAMVGPMYSLQAPYTALVAGGFNIPNCIPEAATTALTDRNQYPNTFRFVSNALTTCKRIMSYVNAMGWTKIAFVYSAQNFGAAYVTGIVAQAHQYGIKILTQQSFNANGNLDDVDLQSAVSLIQSSNARIIIAAGLEDEITSLWMKAYYNGLVTADFVWITPNGILDTPWGSYAAYSGRTVLDFLGPEVANLTGVVMATDLLADETTPQYGLFIQQYLAMLTPDELSNENYADYYSNEESLWDCAMSIFYGYDELLKTNSTLNSAMLVHADYTAPKDPSVPWNMQPFTNISIFNTNKTGLAGPYLFDLGDYTYYHTEMMIEASVFKDGEWDVYPSAADFGGPNMDQIELHPENFAFFGGSTVVPPDLAPPERFNPAWNSAQGAAFSAVAVFLILAHALAGATVWSNRYKAVIKRGSWKSLFLIAMGLAIIDVAPLLYVGTVKNGVCVAQPFVLNIGFGLVFSNLMAKTWRVFRVSLRIAGKHSNRVIFLTSIVQIFNNRKMMSRPISDIQIIIFTSAILAVECVLSIIWVAVSTPVPTTLWLNDVQLVVVCKSPNDTFQQAMTWICVVFNGSLLALTTILSFSTRKVVSEYNETKWIGLSVYNIVAVSALFIPLVYTTAFASFAFALRNIALLVGSGVTGACIFGPKFLVLLRSRHKRPAAQATTFSRTAMGSSAAKMYVSGTRDNLAHRATVAQARKIQSLQLASVPCLLTGTGGVFGLIARWRNANIISSPGCICVEFLEDGTSSGKIMAFRTENAICRSGTTAGTASASSAANLSSHIVDAAEKGNHADSFLGKESVVSAPHVEEMEITFIIETLDGRLELGVTPSIAADLGKHIQGAASVHGTAKSATSATDLSVRKSMYKAANSP